MVKSTATFSGRSRRELSRLPLRRAGRVVVWLVIVVVIARGTLAILDPTRPSRVLMTVAASQPSAPSPAMLWVASAFARAYLTLNAGGDQAAARFFASAANASTASLTGGSASRVTAVAPVAWVQQDASHALITVDAVVSTAGRSSVDRFLVVPVAQRAAGVAVYAEPSLTAAPAVDVSAGSPAREASNPPAAPAAVSALLEQFFPAYFAGQDLTYFEAPGASVTQPQPGLRFESLTSAEQLYSNRDGSVEIRASVIVHDSFTGASYPLQYQLTVKQLDRWVVTNLDAQ